MSDLFLSSVSFKDFRTFGVFDVEITPAPGLTLLVGTNGLGKSSFFDGLEWCLTGQVRRFSGYVKAADQGKYLTRRGANAGDHSARLGFTGGASVERTGKQDASAAAVIALLKRSTWTAQIEDIGTYLAFTHFLGQAAQQRFTSRDRNEQWESLKGPSGIDRLDEVRSSLRGRSTELAFKRRLEREKEAIAELERQLAEWQDWRARLVRLRDAAGAGGALSDDAFHERLERVLVDIESRGIERPAQGLPGETLASVAASLETLRGQILARRTTLEGLADLPQRFTLQLAEMPSGEALAAAVSGLQTASEEAARASDAVANLQVSLSEATALRSSHEADLRSLENIRKDLEAAKRAEAEIQSADLRVRDLQTQLSTLRTTIEDLVATQAALDARQTRIAGLQASLTQANEVANIGERLAAKRSEASLSAAASVAAEQQAIAARASLQALTVQRERATAEMAAARTQRDNARRRASAITSAVSSIATHLHDDDDTCPVCRSHFDPGQLKLLAVEAALAQDSVLAEIDARLAHLERELASVSEEITAAQTIVSAAESASKNAADDQQAISELERQIQAFLPNAQVDLVAAAASYRAAAVAALSAAQSQGAEDQTQRARTTAQLELTRAEVSRVEQELAAAEARASDHSSTRRSALERLASAGHTDTSTEAIDARIADARIALQLASAARATVEENLRQALDHDGVVRGREEQARAAVQRVQAAQEAASAAVNALRQRWESAHLPDQPNAEALENALAQLGERLRDLDRLEDERASLVAAFEESLRHQDLQALIAQMKKVGGETAADDPEPHAVELRTQLENARQAYKTSEDAHTAVEAFAEKLREEARTFSTQFLTPLNGLIDDFNEALLSTPGETVRLNADYHKDRTKFDMGLHYRDPLDDALYDTSLPPQVVLSEGQLAANGFSILCAASTAYPWSSWRALLMDDPLQHNDIIHAAAFVDLMRNLVELQNYQLIMSSHDRGEAEFIRRKFDAAGLPCSVINLTAPSRSGVRYQPPEHNAPARAIFAGLMAKSA
jgi:DNA repair exonuclease SbcCD ATPase subunit